MQRIALSLLGLAILAAAPVRAHVNVPGLDVNGQCVGDGNSDGQVTISELITAVNNALGSCPRLPITLNFQGQVGNQAFACGTIYNGIGTGASQFIPSDFRFYVSNVKLITAAGDAVPIDLDQDGIWQYQNVALLDFEDGTGPCTGDGNSALNTSLHGSAPPGVYTSVQFDLGLPFAIDHGNVATAPSPLNFPTLWWSWQEGYRFMKVDTGDDKFRIHIGSTGCDSPAANQPPATCAHPNVATITLTGFNPEHSVIIADLAALMSDSNLDMNQANTTPGCQSDADDQDCAPLFQDLGLTFPGGAPTTTQKFFRLIRHRRRRPPGSRHRVERRQRRHAGPARGLRHHPAVPGAVQRVFRRHRGQLRRRHAQLHHRQSGLRSARRCRARGIILSARRRDGGDPGPDVDRLRARFHHQRHVAGQGRRLRAARPDPVFAR
jgi:uncharacterized repeat protein (TIGR04052 family)